MSLTKRQTKVLMMSVDGVHMFHDLDDSGRASLRYLESEKLVYTKPLSEPIYFITEKGLGKLQEIEDESAQKSENKTQQRFNRKIAIAQVLVPLITFIFGILIEHYAGIISWIVSRFH